MTLDDIAIESSSIGADDAFCCDVKGGFFNTDVGADELRVFSAEEHDVPACSFELSSLRFTESPSDVPSVAKEL